MVPFYRKLRRIFINQNKLKKYLLYAIGEIVLVVIGILIALQINNLNEQRKNREFEREILLQIRTNLTEDQANLKKIAGDFQQAVRSTDKILGLENIGEDHDSIAYWLGDIIQFDRFRPLSNAFEVLKSNGLDKVSNRDLRFMLGSYYDDMAPKVQASISDIEMAFNEEWIPFMSENLVTLEFKQYVQIENPETFAGPNPGRRLLILNRDNFDMGAARIREGLAKIEDILILIGEEQSR